MPILSILSAKFQHSYSITVVRWQTLGDGIVDACGNALREKRCVVHERSPGWIVRQIGAIDCCLDALELEASTFGCMNIGLIAIGSGLRFLEFQHPHHTCRATQQSLTAWFSQTSQRSSFKKSEPREWISKDGQLMNTWTGWPRNAAS